jgi:hypothetical protein
VLSDHYLLKLYLMVQEGHAGGKACICQWTVQHVAVVGCLVKFEEDKPQKGPALAARIMALDLDNGVGMQVVD